ncbi:MAG: DNA polymerase, partial [bacterium]
EVTPGENFEYWLERNKLDTRMTRDLFVAIWKKFPAAMVRGYLLEQMCIAPLARGWVHGIPYDRVGAERLHNEMEVEKKELCKSIGVPVSVLTSPKQKQKLIFEDWGLEPLKLTPTGAPSTSHDVLMRLHQKSDDSRFDTLMKAIKLATLQSKYTSGFARASAYTGDSFIYGAPRIFGTYTGRMTYSNKTTKKQIHQCSIAMHQLPRKDKAIKHLMHAPDGFGIIGIDANSQETRIMAIESKDHTMIDAYQHGKDLHSVMTASIYGRPYEEVVNGNRDGVTEIVEERQSGKLLNLSCQYRIGSQSLAEKFFTTYEQDISQGDARRYLALYKRQYPGVVRYWDNAIESARSVGYAKTVGGRRYGIERFDWSGESSAINFPIQGGGADHCYATIALINRRRPDLILCLQLHDGLYYFCPLDIIDETVRELKELTRNGIYSKMWKVDLPIDLPYDGSVSYTTFGELREV